jgi:hypothetical protein
MDPEGLNPLIDALTKFTSGIENVIEGLGGGAGMLRHLGAIGLTVFDD